MCVWLVGNRVRGTNHQVIGMNKIGTGGHTGPAGGVEGISTEMGYWVEVKLGEEKKREKKEGAAGGEKKKKGEGRDVKELGGCAWAGGVCGRCEKGRGWCVGGCDGKMKGGVLGGKKKQRKRGKIKKINRGLCGGWGGGGKGSSGGRGGVGGSVGGAGGGGKPMVLVKGES